MKITVAICDDEQRETEYISELVYAWASRGKHEVNIRTFPSAEAFLFCYEEDKSFDILLLDIQMPGLDGIGLARRLRENDDNIQIAFITGFDEYIGDGYEVSALHYLMKPVNEEKLFAVLDRAVAQMNRQEPTAVFDIDGESVKFRLSDIIYAEAEAHRVKLVTSEKSFSLNMPISRITENLKGDFFRCHRSYIVNLAHMSRIGKNEVALDNGTVLPLSRRLYDEMNRTFIDYYRK